MIVAVGFAGLMSTMSAFSTPGAYPNRCGVLIVPDLGHVAAGVARPLTAAVSQQDILDVAAIDGLASIETPAAARWNQ